MNLESASSKKAKLTPVEDLSMDDFDFKPITSGLGFHHPKAQDIKPVFLDKTVPTPVATPMSHPSALKVQAAPAHKELSVYQNDLSIFYGANTAPIAPVAQPQVEEKVEKVYQLATRTQRVLAFVFDLIAIASVLGIVLTIMARTISMDIIEVWNSFPHEITPLVLTLFCGFYLIYFSIFEKSPGSTIGKNMLGIRVVTLGNRPQTFGALLLRSIVTLANFLSLGLFSWFDLQNKITNSKVIQVD